MLALRNIIIYLKRLSLGEKASLVASCRKMNTSLVQCQLTH